MADDHPDPTTAPSLLNQITTRWSIVDDPTQLIVRYAPAVRKYLERLLKNSHDADEVSQEFVVRILDHKFAHASPERGRFRDYIKVAARNAALQYLRKRQTRDKLQADLNWMADDNADEGAGDWLGEWRQCLVDKAWRLLEGHESRTPGNLGYTVLKLSTENPQDSSDEMAARLSKTLGRELRADAFRKQLSRARRTFAQYLLEEIAATLKDPTPEMIKDEVTELGLLPYIQPYLPPEMA